MVYVTECNMNHIVTECNNTDMVHVTECNNTDMSSRRRSLL